MATISWDPEASRYRFRSHLSDGQSGDYRGDVTADGFVWGLETATGAQIRYTIRIEGDRWNEVGEYSPDGNTWNQFFAMDLRRLGE